MNRAKTHVRQETDGSVAFEFLLAEISTHFINLPADRIESEIQEAQHRICECLGFDRSTMWQFSDTDRAMTRLTHVHQSPESPPVLKAADAEFLSSSDWLLQSTGSPPIHIQMQAGVYFPWLELQVRQGQTVLISKLEDLPEEASLDRAILHRYGTKSTAVFPLMTEGIPFGCISFAAMRKECEWTDILVKRLQLVAQVFGNAIVRRYSDLAVREAEERLRLAASSANVGLWSLDMQTGQLWATAPVGEMLGVTDTEILTLEEVMDRVHPEDRELVRSTLNRAMTSETDAQVEYRVIHPTRGIRWITSSGRLHLRSAREPDRLMGISCDVTDRKSAEVALRKSEEKFSRAFDSSPMPMSIISLDEKKYIEINKAHELRTGYSRQEVIGRTVMDVGLWASPEEREQAFAKISSDGGFRDLEARCRTKHGDVRIALLSTDVIEFAGERCILTVAEDITHRKQMEEELQNRLAEIEDLRKRLEDENVILRKEVRLLSGEEDFVARSANMQEVLAKVEQVAGTDSTVLISGETGTGKDLIARIIHNLSRRKNKSLVTVNCAAFPATLIESELFGREKGAYTGAMARMAGRFEIADDSTLFLDEIGELPQELQAKILRFLETGCFERLGSTKTLRVDVRIIAATNRNLAQMVEEGKFRRDLYYRLNVFPIAIPPLRERPEDIPPLVWAFVHQLEKRIGRHIQSIPKRCFKALERYTWPGNARELRNIVEHAMIVSSGRFLDVKPPFELLTEEAKEIETDRKLENVERKHILRVLEETGWRVSGMNGAAEALGLKRTTLEARMKKLGIRRPSI